MTENNTPDTEAESDNAPLLEVLDISYRYGSFNALSHASLTAEPGQLIALVGRNGAGKSTLLKCIAGWTRVTDGDVRVKGMSVNKNERKIREHVVLLPDTPPFYDELTAWEHMQFAAQVHGYSDWEDEAEELLDRYGLLANKEAFPFTFSRGMRYKLALCIALLIEPALLLMDEPLGPLDPVSADDLWHQLHRHRADGMTILLSSHQLPQEAHPDRYIIMESGEIIAQGSPDELRKSLKLTGDLNLDTLLRGAIKTRRGDKEPAHEIILRLMFWLRWRQIQDSIVYGLRMLGYERGERIYALYLVGILGFWVLSMGSFSFDLMINIGKNIHPRDLSTFLTLLPPVVLVGQVYVLVSALQTTPLKLTFPDMAYVSASPVQAVAMVLPGFTRQVILRLLLIVPVVMLLSALIARATGMDSTAVESVSVSLRAVVPTVLIVLMTWAAAWLFGILRLVYPAVGRSSILWAVPILLLPLALVVPNAMMFAAQTVIVAALGELPTWVLLFLAAVTVLLMIGIVRFSRRINVTHAIDESQLYARIQALGLLAWRQVDVQMRVRVQSRQAGRRAWLRLPTGVSERQAIAIRAVLTYVRHPMMLITTLLWGSAMTLAALMIIRAGLPIPLLVGWVLVAGFAPPVGLLYVYRIDTQEKFLRQFLLVDGFILLIADSIVPLMALVLGGVLVMLVQNLPSETILSGLLFVIIVAMVQLLCGAYGVAKGERALQSRLIAIVISYIVIAVGFSLLSFTGALIASFLVVTTLMGLIAEA